MTSYNEWGVISNNKPYAIPITQNDLKNALCAKNYEVGSVFSESYSNIRQLVKDTNIYQDKNVSVYQIGSVVSGTSKIWLQSPRGLQYCSDLHYGRNLCRRPKRQDDHRDWSVLDLDNTLPVRGRTIFKKGGLKPAAWAACVRAEQAGAWC